MMPASVARCVGACTVGLVVVLSILLQVKVVIFILIDDVYNYNYNYDVNIQIKWWYLVHVYCSEESCLEGKDDILHPMLCLGP